MGVHRVNAMYALVLAGVIALFAGCDPNGQVYGDVRDSIDTQTPISVDEANAWLEQGFDPQLFNDLDAWTSEDVGSFERATQAIVVKAMADNEDRVWTLADSYVQDDGTRVEVYRSGALSMTQTTSVGRPIHDPNDGIPDSGILVESPEFRALGIDVPANVRPEQGEHKGGE